MTQLYLQNLSMLWLLALVPPAGAVMVWLAWRHKQQLLPWFGQEEIWKRFSRLQSAGHSQWKGVCVFLALSAMIVALARPSIEEGRVKFPRGTIDIIALVDESRSMAVLDYKDKVTGDFYGGGTRLDMAKYLLINDVVESLHGNRLGMVAFAGTAFPQGFLTDDMQAMDWELRRAVTIGAAPGEGSSLSRAFNLAFQLFDLDSVAGHRKKIVLFSDGGNDDDADVLTAVLNECRSRGIEVIVVGLGKNANAPIPVSELSPLDQGKFRGRMWYEYDGEVVTNTAIDENTLRLIARKTGGRYVHVGSPSDFHIGAQVSDSEVIYIKGKQEFFWIPLFLSVVFWALAVISSMEVYVAKANRTPGN